MQSATRPRGLKTAKTLCPHRCGGRPPFGRGLRYGRRVKTRDDDKPDGIKHNFLRHVVNYAYNRRTDGNQNCERNTEYRRDDVEPLSIVEREVFFAFAERFPDNNASGVTDSTKNSARNRLSNTLLIFIAATTPVPMREKDHRIHRHTDAPCAFV